MVARGIIYKWRVGRDAFVALDPCHPAELALGKTWLQNRRKRARDGLGYIAIAAAVSFGSSVVGGRFLEWSTAFFLAAAAVFCLLLMLVVYFNQPVSVLEEQASLADYVLQSERREDRQQL